MSGFMLMPLPMTVLGSSVTSYGFDASFPLANLADIQPKTVLQSSPATAAGYFEAYIDLDFGADMPADTVAVMFTNLSATATWTLWGFTSAHGLPSLGSETSGDLMPGFAASSAFGQTPTVAGARRHALWAGASRTVRYMRVQLHDTTAANPELLIRIGRILAGKRLQPGFNFEPDSGRKIMDQSAIRYLPGGETGVERGGVTPVFRCTWSNMTAAELVTHWAIISRVGIGSPILLVEEADATTGLNEGMHYGLFDSPDFDSRTLIDKSTISCRVVEMT